MQIGSGWSPSLHILRQVLSASGEIPHPSQDVEVLQDVAFALSSAIALVVLGWQQVAGVSRPLHMLFLLPRRRSPLARG